MTDFARRLACWLLGLSLLLAGACDRTPSPEQQEPDTLEPKPNELPPLELRDDIKDLLLTWVDEKGDFHVVQKVADVPEKARAQVRVVVATRREGTGRLVYVADLRQAKPDGTYPVHTLTRAQWDEVGAGRRKARLEALAPSSRPPIPAPSKKAPGRSATDGKAGVVAFIYGASWCKPCHDAARYLQRLGVKVVEKNVEEDPLAQREMQAKLKRANLPGTASIPIIDVGGRILVGFSPPALQRAVKAAQNTKSL
jgi:glutaredoxin